MIINYAIIQLLGKQYFISPKKIIDINFNLKINNFKIITINKILLLKKENKIQIGYPFLKNIKLYAKVIQITNKKKIIILKTKPKKNYTKKQGHKQKYIRIQFINI